MCGPGFGQITPPSQVRLRQIGRCCGRAGQLQRSGGGGGGQVTIPNLEAYVDSLWINADTSPKGISWRENVRNRQLAAASALQRKSSSTRPGAVTTSPPGWAHRRSPARARRSPPPGKIPADKAGNGSAVRLTARFAGSALWCWLADRAVGAIGWEPSVADVRPC